MSLSGGFSAGICENTQQKGQHGKKKEEERKHRQKSPILHSACSRSGTGSGAALHRGAGNAGREPVQAACGTGRGADRLPGHTAPCVARTCVQ